MSYSVFSQPYKPVFKELGITGSTHDTLLSLLWISPHVSSLELNSERKRYIWLLNYNDESNLMESWFMLKISLHIFHFKISLYTMIVQQLVTYYEKPWKIWNLLIKYVHFLWDKFILEWHTAYFVCYTRVQRDF